MNDLAPTRPGLPGRVTAVSYDLPAHLRIEEWAQALQLLGRMSISVSWWIGDALIFGERRYGEQMAQYVSELGLSEKTMLNALWVCKSVHPSQRRDAPLSFGHHDAVARLAPEDQDAWLNRAEAGDVLPNGEKRPWSVSRLRQELRALGNGQSEKPERIPCSHCGGSGWEP